MTTSLRHKHLIIWGILLILIPLFIFLSKQQKVSYLALKPDTISSMPFQFEVKNHHLYIDVNTPFVSAAALLYIHDGNKEYYLGDVTQRAHYNFSIPRGSQSIKVIDAINKEILFESQL